MSLDGSNRDRFGASLSPSDLAEISRNAILQRYLPKNSGLFGSGWARFMADRAAAPPDPQQNIPPRFLSARAPSADSAPAPGNQLAALSFPSRWPIPVPGCTSCHGPSQPPVTPPTTPPHPPVVDDPWTYYPGVSRRDGGAWGTSPSSSGDDRKQCEIQEGSDTATCKRQVSPDPDETLRVRAVCHASKMDRYEHCLRTGEVGTPTLQTTKVQQGEPPIRRWRKPR